MSDPNKAGGVPAHRLVPCRWVRAVRTVIVRRRVSVRFQQQVDQRLSSVAALSRPFSSMFGSATLAPQLAVRCALYFPWFYTYVFTCLWR